MSNSPKIPPKDNPPFDENGLIKACYSFPPLLKLWEDLDRIEESESGRADLDEILEAIFKFLDHIPTRHQDERLNGLPVRRIADLMLALHDLDQGKAPPLLQMDQVKRFHNRNTKTGEGLAYDFIIAARRYLMTRLNHSEDDAHKSIARKLQSRGLRWVTQKNIDSWQRHHNNESNRETGRADARNQQISSAEDLNGVLDRIANLLSHKTS